LLPNYQKLCPDSSINDQLIKIRLV